MRDLRSRFNVLWERYGIALSAGLLIVLPPVVWLIGSSIGDAILWATGLVLVAYTIETQGMRREIVRQNEIAIQPLLIAKLDLWPVEGRLGQENRDRLILRNIGKGVALFNRVESILLLQEPERRYVIKADPIDYIEPGEKRAVQLRVIRMGPGSDEHDTGWGDLAEAHLDPEFANRTFDVSTSCEDIHGQKWQSVVQAGRGGICLLRQGKVTG